MIYPTGILEVLEFKIERDEFGNTIGEKETWVEVAEARCTDNTTFREINVNGEVFIYAHKIIYHGKNIKAGAKVRFKGRFDNEEVMVTIQGNYFGYNKLFTNASKVRL